MNRLEQFGITLAAVGFVLTLMGLFPGVTGVTPGAGVGPIQFLVVLSGFSLVVLGGLVYVKYTFYPTRPPNLAQQIGIRLALTGLIVTGIAGLADFLGFGSHIMPDTEALLGSLQAAGVLGGFALACVGVIVYALAGGPRSGS